ncbi:MAG: phosphonate monoester hydrolase [Alphaproteobacteria bacterium]|nr:phosphonate monoester hydrolase [Alphaproteobacteria bacterium]
MSAVRNVLFIMCDQLRHDYLSCAGHPSLKTPHIDALAGGGVLFRNAFCTSAVCGPSRMSFYTGRYAQTHGSTWNGVPLPVDELTLGDHLRPLGLRVALAGKTHFAPDIAGMRRLGLDPAAPETLLLREGGFEPFDRYEGHVRPPDDAPYMRYLKTRYPGEDPWSDVVIGAAGPGGETLGGWLIRNAHLPARVAEADSETAYTTDRAMAFIKEQADQPWCLHLSYIKPHWPYLAPAPYHAMYPPETHLPLARRDHEIAEAHPVVAAYRQTDEGLSFGREEVATNAKIAYMGLVKQIDDHIGRLMAFLAQEGRRDDTMIVFTSDHGDFLGDHWLGEKELFYEQAVRIPLIVVDPGTAAAPTRGTVDDRLVEGIDLLPTFIEALGGTVPTHIVEGRSLLPHLRGGPVEARDAVFCELDYGFRRVRQTLGRAPRDCRGYMVRTKRWKYVEWPGFAPQLFDLDDDPSEYRDLGADGGNAGIRREMKERLFERLAWRKTRTRLSDAEVEARTDNHRARGIHIGIW